MERSLNDEENFQKEINNLAIKLNQFNILGNGIKRQFNI